MEISATSKCMLGLVGNLCVFQVAKDVVGGHVQQLSCHIISVIQYKLVGSELAIAGCSVTCDELMIMSCVVIMSCCVRWPRMWCGGMYSSTRRASRHPRCCCWFTTPVLTPSKGPATPQSLTLLYGLQVAKDVVGGHVQQRMQSEQEAKERKKREKDEAPFFTHVRSCPRLLSLAVCMVQHLPISYIFAKPGKGRGPLLHPREQLQLLHPCQQLPMQSNVASYFVGLGAVCKTQGSHAGYVL